MSDQKTKPTAAEKAASAEQAAALKKQEARAKFEQKQEDLKQSLEAGTLLLDKPLRAGGKDLAELHYDFSDITGWEYAEAMDSDKNTANVFVMSTRQSLALFAKAAAKHNPGVDEIDIKERLSALDAMEAAQVTTLFFKVSAQIRNRRTYSV